MTIDDEVCARIRQALEETQRVDAARVQVTRAQDRVVLRGAVATPEEATVAAQIAERHAADVRNEMRVDPGLRETAGSGALPPAGSPPADPSRSPEVPSQPADDLTSDVSEALGESLAWDPPDDPVAAPTASEQRGQEPRETSVPPASDPGPVDEDDGGEPSAADLSAAELERSAHPQRDEET